MFPQRSAGVLFILMFSINFYCSAQVPVGNPPFATIQNAGIFSVNLQNLNVHVTIPVLHKAGRGIPFNYDLGYDSSVLYPVGSGSSGYWLPVPNLGWNGALQGQSLAGKVTYSTTTGYCYTSGNNYPTGGYTYTTSYIYTDPNGTTHGFPVTTFTAGGTGSAYGLGYDCATYRLYFSSPVGAGDGSGYTLNTNLTVANREGIVLNPAVNINGFSVSGITDTNGNNSHSDSNGVFTDTLGTTALTISGSSPVQFSYTAPSGAAANVKVNYSTNTIKTNFGCGQREYGPASLSLVSSITLPDNSSYQFAYEPTPGTPTSRTGRIASITLPTGGQITFTYTGSNNGVVCSNGSAAGLTIQTPDGTWTYTRPSTGTASTTIVKDPKGNETKYQFQGLIQTKQEVYNGTVTGGQLLETIDTCYNGNTNRSSCITTAVALPITQEIKWISLPSPSGRLKETDTYLNSYGLITEVDDFDFGAGVVGSKLRRTVVTYNTSLTNNIRNRPSSVSIYDGGGNLQARTSYGYDETGVTSTSDTPSLNAVTGSRGNLTSVHRLVTGSTYLDQSFSYFDTGNLNVATDVNNATTSYEYGASSCGNSFPTKVTLPTVNLTLERREAWNCTGGVMTSSMDENGQSSSSSYTADPYFWRPESTTDLAGNVTNFSYSQLSNPGPYQTESVMSFNGGASSVDLASTTDNMGRPKLFQRRQKPGLDSFDSVQTDYDSAGMTWKTYLPFQSALGGTAASFVGKTSSYDALGRTTQSTDSGNGSVTFTYTKNDVLQVIGPAPANESVKQKQFEYDGLGRLASVCEITGATGSGNCAQVNSKTGYWTVYTYNALGNLTGVTQNAQGTAQSRSFGFDGLSRMTSESNPENGTTYYTYDSDSTCGNSKGDLVKRVDAVGNVTCYAYDALHRLTTITYPKGQYASATPSKYYVYDSATVNSVVMANAKGRLARAYTSASIAFQNTDFESSSTLPPVDWSAYAAILSYDTTTQLDGARSLKTTTTGIYGGAYSSLLAGVAGKSYTVSGFVRSDGTCLAYIQIRFLDLNGAYLDSAQTSATAQTGWQFVTATNVAPAGTVSLQLGLPNANPSGAGVCEFDDISTRSSSTYTTDLGFSYSARGEVTAVYESTPNSGGYYSVAGTYWANGTLNQMSSSFAPTITYGVDGEGRMLTVQASTGQNPIPADGSNTSVLYNPAGQVTDVKLGSGDRDHFSYDSSTGRMTGYKFTIGVTPQDVVGILVWNANGSLGSLTTTDPFNPTRNQTCSYSHDDLSRIVASNCGSVWSQTFGFDPFGNINKDGNSRFLATYNTSKNQIASLDSAPPPTYDLNGNLLTITDGTSHSYSWDAEGKQIGIDNMGATYDALGRIVELSNAGTYVQTSYGLAGQRLALMNGQSLQKAFIPLPSGSAVVTSTGVSYYRHSDWLGSSRFASTDSQTMYSTTSYAPYGESYAEEGTHDRNFTGQDQDIAAPSYDFLFRRYNSTQGRWISPDPSGIAAVDISSPQTWNRYAYVQNRVLDRIDPLGLNAYAGCHTYAIDGVGEVTICDDGGSGGGGGGGGIITPGDCLDISIDGLIVGNTCDGPRGGGGEGGGGGGGGHAGGSRGGNKPAAPSFLQAQSDCLQLNGVRQITYSLHDSNDKPLSNFYVTEHVVDRLTGKPNVVVTRGDNRSGPGTSSETKNIGTFIDLIGGTNAFDVLQTFTVSTTPPGQKGGVNIPVFIVDDSGNSYGTNGIVYEPSKGAYVNGTVAHGLCN